jgi:hypothetical protein
MQHLQNKIKSLVPDGPPKLCRASVSDPVGKGISTSGILASGSSRVLLVRKSETNLCYGPRKTNCGETDIMTNKDKQPKQAKTQKTDTKYATTAKKKKLVTSGVKKVVGGAKPFDPDNHNEVFITA